jgi:hypothetical protein
MNIIELELAHHHHEELVQEADNERLARGLREDRPRPWASRLRSGRNLAGLRRAMGLWGRTSTPFFRA